VARRESVPGGRLVWFLAIALGLSSAGSLVHRNSEPPADTRPAPAVPVRNASEARPAEVATPSALLRPLALLAKEVGPEPLFWLKDPGKPELSRSYALPAAPEGTYIYCPRLAPQAFTPAPGGNGFVPVGEWRAADYECGLVLKVKQHAALQNISVDIVVATLPDWVDSSLQWTFDPMMDAIQASAGQMGYSLVGFDMVDTDPDPASVQPKGSVWPFPRVHEITPGAVLFRKVNESTRGLNVLLLLLVGETATAGAHQQALANALDFALLWRGQAADTVPSHDGRRNDAIRVLGPTYSGSAIPLREALDEARARHGLAQDSGRAWFDVVTGSASSPDNRQWLAADGVATFRSVIRSDPEVLTAVARFLGQTRHEWFCGNHVALLVEGNTTWGQGFFGPRRPGIGAQPAGLKSGENLCTLCNSSPSDYYDRFRLGSTQSLPCATLVAFPLHISRLRDAAQHSTTAVASATPSRSVVSLDLSESVQPGDLIPAETPQVTSASVETMVSGMMRVLRDRRITAVGVLATDKRDHIYLAEEIARLHPNVLPFTLESALMYLHPDVNGYMRGTIVASTYSLNERTQRFTRSALAQRNPQQFSTSVAHGAFNALALLMGQSEKMIDYESPVAPSSRGALAEGNCPLCLPPVWISVVGRNALLPVTRDLSGTCTSNWKAKEGYIACRGEGTASDPSSSVGSNRTYSYLVARHLVLVLGAAFVLILIAYQVRVQARIDTNRPCAPVEMPVPPAAGSPLAAPTPVQRLDASALAYRDAVRSWLRSLRRPPDVQNTCSAEIAAGLLAMRAATLVIVLGLAKLGAIYAADGLAVPILPFWIVFDVAAGLGTLYLLWQARDTFWIKRDGAPPEQARGVQLARLAALLAVGCVLVGGVLENEGIMGPGWSGLLRFVAAACALATMLWDWDSEIGTPVGLISRWRRFPVLLGILAFLWLALDLAWRHWSDVDSLLYADRTAAMSALLSPAANVLFITIAVFSWGGWAISRVGLMRLPEIETGVGPLIGQAARSAGINPKLAFQEPAMTTGTLIAAPTLVVLLALAFGSAHSGSIDGYQFGGYLLFSATAVIGVLTHTLANSTYLGFAVVYLLRCLAHHPGSATFKKLARDAISWRISFRRVRMIELAALLERLERVRGETVDDTPKLILAAGSAGRSADTVLRTPAANTNPPVVMVKEAWLQINTCVANFYNELRATKWHPDFDSSLMPQSETRVYDDMEYIVFFHAAIVLRDQLTRLISGFTIVFCGLLALVLSHLFYTFQGRVYWLSFDAIVLAIATLIAVVFLSFLERDAILSSLWRTKPGRISLFSGLTWRMAAYAGILAATLFTVFFPELGGRLASWLVPARSLIE
jgi:hypothetical protein